MISVADLDRDPNRLTEFGDCGGPDEEDVVPSIGNSFAKWLWGSSSSAKESTKDPEVPTKSQFFTGDTQDAGKDGPDARKSTVENPTLVSSAEQPKTPPSVMDRVKTLFGGSGTSTEADLKAFWMPDAVSKQCYECGEKFTTFRRRHHCRVCGQIFCSKCRSEELPGKLIGIKGNLKVCKYCGKVALSYMTSSAQNNSNNNHSIGGGNGATAGTGREPSPREVLDHRTISESESTGSFVTSPDGPMRKKSTAVGYQEELFTSSRTASPATASTSNEANFSAAVPSISDGFADLMIALAFCTERSQSKPDESFFPGHELIEWMVREGKSESELEAQAKAATMVGRGLFLPARERRGSNTGVFEPEALYSVNKVLDFGQDKPKISENDPTWVEQIHGSDLKSSTVSPSSTTMYLNTTTEEEMLSSPNWDDSTTPVKVLHSISVDSVGDSTSLHPDPSMSHISEEFLRESVLSRMSKHNSFPAAVGWHSSGNLNKENGELTAFTRLMEGYSDHERRLVNQLIEQNGLDSGWADIILPLVHKIVEVVRPDVKNENDDMDIRQYVQIKKVPGGSRSETSLLNGVACTKNVAHRTMSVRLTNPQILLLGTSLMYQRGESKFISLEPLVLQEYEYLKNAVAKMMSYKPDIIMIEKTAARVAQDLLKDCGVTLIINVKPTVMERVARLTQAQIVPCMDAQIVKPRLGMCHSFYLRTFDDPDLPGYQKTLMFFDGCASHLGITVVLRGGSRSELQKVKSVIQFLILVAYNFRLERSFLMDEGAMPPSPASGRFSEDSTPNTTKESPETIEAASPTKTPEPKLEDFLDCSSLARHDLETFENVLKNAVLYSSPFLTNDMPFLLTEEGMKSRLRNFFPEELYCAHQDHFSMGDEMDFVDKRLMRDRMNPKLPNSEYHPFIVAKVTSRVQKNDQMQTLLSDFRARGGLVRPSTGFIFRERLRTHCSSVTSAFTEVEYCSDAGPDAVFERTANALDPHNHQRIAVLFSSYSPDSQNAPHYCMHPWVVNMDFYGRNDIPLGGFLERYCFRSTYKCPSVTCSTDMKDHIRRFVHDKGCVQIIMRELSEPIPVKHSGILVWNWCSKCQQISNVVPLSVDGWGFSFAKYLELRFHGGSYKRRGTKPRCQHSLHHEHYQYFGSDKVVVSFKYYPIVLREIVLPPRDIDFMPMAIATRRATLIEEVSSLSVQGHGSYSSIFEKLHELEALADSPKFQEMLKSMAEALDCLRCQFRAVLDDLQMLLANLKTAVEVAGAEKMITDAEDKIVMVKVLQCKIIAMWNVRIQEIYAVKKKEDKSRPSSTKLAVEPVTTENAEPSETSLEGSTKEPTTRMSRSESIQSLAGRKSTISESTGQSTTSKETDGKKNPFLASLACLASQPLPFPFPATQHMLLPGCPEVPVVIYEKEPSSIIAYTLSSVEYRNFLAELEAGRDKARNFSGGSHSEFQQSTDSKKAVFSLFNDSDSKSTISDPSFDSSSLPGSSVPTINVEQSKDKEPPTLHPEFQFFDSTGKFYCKVYFADHFRMFRTSRLMGSGGEAKFVRSLTRCVSWAAKGGKSGSNFCKTVDDRFILKQMSRFEMQSFLDFGPHYFNYLARTDADGSPTTLVKILGVYRLGYKNTQNNSGSKMDVLVMENLFYGRQVAQKFDLKGSVRNRLAKDNSKLETDYVLLDENLLKMTCGCPLYVRPHSKFVLTRAISNDTQFLAAQDVMDYSLLVGVDEDNDELLVGIIDYIRTFTWDKKLEMVVKSSGILGGQGKLPTVVSPELYRARFCEAMSKYFLLVPDRWTDLARALP